MKYFSSSGQIACIVLFASLFNFCQQPQKREISDQTSLESANISEADLIIKHIINARKNKFQINPLTQQFGTFTIEEGYFLQEKLTQSLITELGPVVGYKMAFATESALKKFKLKEPIYGPLFKKQEIKNRGEVFLDDFMQFHIENEIAFVMNENIEEPILSIDTLKHKIKSVHLAFDMADGRFDRSSGREPIPDFIAAGGGAHRFLLGNPLRNPGISTDNIQLIITHNNKVVYKGDSNEAYGDPLRALFWIINDLIEKGKPVKKDMVFLTGKVDAPYVPEGKFAKGLYRGTAEGFPDIECTMK
jgi:2-keto-4-pentenoate hydratase